MNRLLACALASLFAVTPAPAALAADAPAKDAAAAKKPLQKPANVTADAWAKMSDAEKTKAVDAAQKETSAKPAKKEKKGGC